MPWSPVVWRTTGTVSSLFVAPSFQVNLRVGALSLSPSPGARTDRSNQYSLPFSRVTLIGSGLAGEVLSLGIENVLLVTTPSRVLSVNTTSPARFLAATSSVTLASTVRPRSETHAVDGLSSELTG